MLTDIFANRYADTPIWTSFGETESRLLVQCFRIISEQMFPYWKDGKENPVTKVRWSSVHDKLTMELGLKELSPKYYSYQTTWNGKPYNHSGAWSLDKVCEKFMYALPGDATSADRFVKERISFVELAFREREEEIAEINRDLPRQIQMAEIDEKTRRPGRLRLPGAVSRVDYIRETNARINDGLRASIDELNERLRRAGTNLHYHNGFIQISSDELLKQQIEEPFWSTMKGPQWKNVDTDMKEAIDRRDAGARDPALYAVRALESAIKIISDEKKWTHGGEKGAHNYIDNLGSKKSGYFIADWEREALKSIFTAVRNPLGHGPGGEKMPELTTEQTNWTIEICMVWIKSLVHRS